MRPGVRSALALRVGLGPAPDVDAEGWIDRSEQCRSYEKSPSIIIKMSR